MGTDGDSNGATDSDDSHDASLDDGEELDEEDASRHGEGGEEEQHGVVVGYAGNKLRHRSNNVRFPHQQDKTAEELEREKRARKDGEVVNKVRLVCFSRTK